MPFQIFVDPLAGIAILAVFVATAMLTIRRASYGLAALIFVAPFAFERDALGTEITLAKVVLAGVVVGLSTYTRLWPLLRERASARVIMALIAVAIATAISIIPAQFHAPVVREILKAFEHVALVAVAYIAYRLDANDDLLRNAFTLSIVLVSLSALFELDSSAPSALIFHGTILPRIAGSLSGPNQLGGYLELGVAVLGAWSTSSNSIVTRIALGFSTWVLVMTFSRGASVGVVVIVAVLICCGREPMRAVWPIAAGAMAGCASALFIFIQQFALQHSASGAHSAEVAGAVSSTATSAEWAGGVGNRGELWRAAWVLWRAHPWLGVGAGNFELDLPQAGLVGVRTHANSWYIQSLVEGGIPLFAATIAFIAILLRELQRRVKHAGPWVLAAFAGSLALCVHQTIDYLVFYQKVGTPWMLLIGIGLAATMSGEPSSDR